MKKRIFLIALALFIFLVMFFKLSFNQDTPINMRCGYDKVYIGETLNRVYKNYKNVRYDDSAQCYIIPALENQLECEEIVLTITESGGVFKEKKVDSINAVFLKKNTEDLLAELEKIYGKPKLAYYRLRYLNASRPNKYYLFPSCQDNRIRLFPPEGGWTSFLISTDVSRNGKSDSK